MNPQHFSHLGPPDPPRIPGHLGEPATPAQAQANNEAGRVAAHVSRLRDIAYDVRRLGHPLSAEKIAAAAQELHDVVRAIDQQGLGVGDQMNASGRERA